MYLYKYMYVYIYMYYKYIHIHIFTVYANIYICIHIIYNYINPMHFSNQISLDPNKPSPGISRPNLHQRVPHASIPTAAPCWWVVFNVSNVGLALECSNNFRKDFRGYHDIYKFRWCVFMPWISNWFMRMAVYSGFVTLQGQQGIWFIPLPPTIWFGSGMSNKVTRGWDPESL